MLVINMRIKCEHRNVRSSFGMHEAFLVVG